MSQPEHLREPVANEPATEAPLDKKDHGKEAFFIVLILPNVIFLIALIIWIFFLR